MSITRKTKNLLIAVCAVTTVTAAGVGISHVVKKDEPCKHDYGTSAVSIVKDATCEGKGEELWKCQDCGDEITKEIAAKGHSFDEGVVTEGACTQGGTLTYTCEDCGETKTETLAAKGHTFVDVAAVAPTCTAEGASAYSVCEICGEYETEKTIIPALGHTLVVDEAEAPTCKVPGKTEGESCSVCGEVVTPQEEIAVLAHREEIDESVAATCTTLGKSEGKHCPDCGEVLVEQEIIPILAHREEIDEGVAATCTIAGKSEGKHCVDCGEILVEQTEIPALGHQETVAKGTAATCTADGKMDGKQCSVCGEILKAQEIVPAMGHKEEIDIGVAATCTTVGKTNGKHCSVCGEVLVSQEEIPVLPHTEAVIKGGEPTCTTEGATDVLYCSVCKAMLETQETIPVLGHKFGADYKCSVCGEVDAETMAGKFVYTLSYDKMYYSLTGLGEVTATDIVIPNEYNGLPVKEIGSDFAGDVKLTSVVIPEGIERIGMNAFGGQGQITELIIPKSIKDIQPYAFSGMTVLTKMIIPGEVAGMMGPIFGQCTSLKKIVFESKVTFTGSAVFRDCASLESIEFLSMEMCTTSGSDLELIESAKIYVPASLLEAYKTDEYWSAYASQFVALDEAENVLTDTSDGAGTLIFMADGVELDRVSYNSEDQNIIEPTVPEKTGYTGAWESYELDYTNKMVNAVYEPIEYTVTYISACSDFDETNDNYYVFGSQSQVKNHTVSGGKYPTTYTIEDGNLTVSPLKSFFQIKRPLGGGMNALDGYGFGGWYLDKKCTQPFSGTIPAGSTGNITLYAKLMYSGTNY